jgi:hypothetical protein
MVAAAAAASSAATAMRPAGAVRVPQKLSAQMMSGPPAISTTKKCRRRGFLRRRLFPLSLVWWWVSPVHPPDRRPAAGPHRAEHLVSPPYSAPRSHRLLAGLLRVAAARFAVACGEPVTETVGGGRPARIRCFHTKVSRPQVKSRQRSCLEPSGMLAGPPQRRGVADSRRVMAAPSSARDETPSLR